MPLTVCPLCDTEISFTGSFCKCKRCSIVINTEWKTEEYNDSYFTEEYRRQYGKSYEEDYNTIYRISSNRLSVIDDLVSRFDVEKQIFDVGCAYGFFLKAASDRGYECSGIEISAHAAAYSQNHFSFDVKKKSLQETEPSVFSIVTFWYVVEHFYNIKEMIKKLTEMVKMRGIIAFSVPSWFGPSFFFHRNKWILQHPQDHRVDFSPKGIRKILKEYGFSHIIIRPASYHPERILTTKSIFFPVFSGLYKIISRITGFGDTIDIFAVKR